MPSKMTLVTFLALELEGGAIQAAHVFATQAQLDEWLEDWAGDHGYDSYEAYQDRADGLADVVWYTIAVRADQISLDAVITVS
ncbi:MAG: hypothetical protein KKA73_28790 [Chloroflexi bacterium]|nr:hypothetical protein [Chloroflexota bacterium]